ncbi:uncharacterized protein MKZ38_000803 [Zalerion maritima]|uniref:SMODS and SLOG-associating 2TM effector domain-containing protein n=1 Tax=Zalerion maritima TaxID=339359 RepID=A0AAD5RYV0_9PEZI|nr:uncharacterized protein MKZ38_000803 [Zalerion maritima]
MAPVPAGSSPHGAAPTHAIPNSKTGNPAAHGELSPLVTKGSLAFAPTTTAIPENGASVQFPNQNPPSSALQPTPSQPLRKADTNISWGQPAGLPMRGVNDEFLRIFRTAVGINAHMHHSGLHGGGTPGGNGKNSTTIFVNDTAASPYNCTPDLEKGRKIATGIYDEVLKHVRARSWQHHTLALFLYFLYFMQILIGAALTALGPEAGKHGISITCLGACNTVIAGLLALIKGQGLPERMRNDEVEFRRLRDWIEETEALLAVGVLGRDRKEVGVLVETAFRKYNAATQSEDDNKPEAYVSARIPDDEEKSVRKMK